MRKMFALMALLVSVFALMPAGHAADTAIRIGYQPGTSPRFFVARDQHLFEQAGLAPQYVKFISAPPMLAALQGQNIDVAFMTTPPVIFALSQGIKVRIFFIESDAAKTQALVSTKAAGITSLAGQKGKRIAVTFGTSAQYGLLKSFRAGGISDSQATVLDMQPSAMLPAFINGDIDGAWSWDPWTAKMQNEGGTLVGSLATLHLPMPGVWVVRADWLAYNGEAIQRFIKAMDVATVYMQGHASDAVKAISDELGVDPKTAQLIFSRIEVPALPDQIHGYVANLDSGNSVAASGMAVHLNDLANFFYGLKKIPTKPDVIAAIDPGPLQMYLHK
jgi:taurine transport system substrate-binding protein